jgi:hypothetical protein
LTKVTGKGRTSKSDTSIFILSPVSAIRPTGAFRVSVDGLRFRV